MEDSIKTLLISQILGLIWKEGSGVGDRYDYREDYISIDYHTHKNIDDPYNVYKMGKAYLNRTYKDFNYGGIEVKYKDCSIEKLNDILKEILSTVYGRGTL